MDINELNTKIELTDEAIDLYQRDQFTIPNLVDATGKSSSEIYSLFPNKKAILRFYYPSLLLKYRAMLSEIEDFEDYRIGEKLSNFMYTLFDMMEERKSFVKDTFEKYEWNCSGGSEFQKEIKALFKDFFTTDGNIATSAGLLIGDLFYGALKTQYLFLIRYWLQDDSEGHARTYALIDKMTGLLEELVYSKIVDKGFDLFKYVLNTSGLREQFEEMNDWASQWFHNDTANTKAPKEDDTDE